MILRGHISEIRLWELLLLKGLVEVLTHHTLLVAVGETTLVVGVGSEVPATLVFVVIPR